MALNCNSWISEKEAAEKYHEQYKEDLKGLQKLTVTDETCKASWNKHMFVPLKGTVYVHPNQEGVKEGYIKVIHSKFHIICTFDKHNFKEFQNEHQ